MREARLGGVDAAVLAAVAALPWFWGGTDLGSTRLVAAILASAAAGLAMRISFRRLFPRQAWTLWAPAFALAAFGAFQATPLPAAVVSALSPQAARRASVSFPIPGAPAAAWLAALEERARTAVPEAGGAPPAVTPARPGPGAPAARRLPTISLAPGATLELTLWFSALLLAFAVVLRRCHREERGRAYQSALFGLFTALAAVSIAHRLTSPSTVLWLAAAPSESRPFGPYVNATHFAGAMELGVPWMLGYWVSRVAREGRKAITRWPVVLAGLGWVTGLLASLLAASKTAVLLLLASSAVLLLTAARGRHARRLRIGAAVLIAVVSVLVVAGGYLGERLEAFGEIYGGAILTNDRAVVWKAAAPMFRDYPWVGSGLGAFAVAFPPYMPAGEAGLWGQAHSDWVELATGGGLVALGLTLALAAAYIGRFRRALASAGSARGAVLGAGLGVASLTLHALVDFNHQIPANALLFVVTAAWAAARPEPAEESHA